MESKESKRKEKDTITRKTKEKARSISATMKENSEIDMSMMAMEG